MKKIILPIIITLVFGFISFYFGCPPINVKSPDFWGFLFSLIICFLIAFIIFGKFIKSEKIWVGIKNSSGNFTIDKSKINMKLVKTIAFAVGALIVLYILLILTASPLLRAKSYQQMLSVKDGNFNKEISEIPISQIPIVDKDTAERLGLREIGGIVDLVSQFEVAETYTQINLKNVPTRVSPLGYADFIKWMSNNKNGIPYYVTIDMATQETDLVKLEKGIKYSPFEYFNRDLMRHLRFKYPAALMEDPSFEVDDNGNPYWIVSLYDYKIGFIGGKDTTGILMVNAVTGETSKYSVSDIPKWVDRVYPSDMVIEQINNWGKYKNGFWNSVIGQKGVLQCTDGYNYIALNDDVWLYTGVTSVSSDQSNLGFVLINLRTKETKYYPINGAEEYSAMGSAEGKVQEKGYIATFPILINIAGEPTYFISLKDNEGLVKSYAFVSVKNYQTVGVGDTIAAAQSQYASLLGNKQSTAQSITVTGNIESISTAVKGGNTIYYIKLTGNDDIFVASIEISDFLPTLKQGDYISAEYTKDAGGLCRVSSIKKGSI